MDSKQLLVLAIDAEDKKLSARKQQHELAEELEELNTKGLSSSDFLKLKDFFYYMGSHNDYKLDISNIKYPDRISKLLCSLKDMLRLFYEIGCTNMLDSYFEELEILYGIKISFNGNVAPNPDELDKIQEMCDYQKIICTNADKIKLTYSRDAENINFVKRVDFKDIVDIEYNLNKSKQIEKATTKGKKIKERLSLKSNAIKKYVLST